VRDRFIGKIYPKAIRAQAALLQVFHGELFEISGAVAQGEDHAAGLQLP
jgi:hypothetical protein